MKTVGMVGMTLKDCNQLRKAVDELWDATGFRSQTLHKLHARTIKTLDRMKHQVQWPRPEEEKCGDPRCKICRRKPRNQNRSTP